MTSQTDRIAMSDVLDGDEARRWFTQQIKRGFQDAWLGNEPDDYDYIVVLDVQLDLTSGNPIEATVMAFPMDDEPRGRIATKVVTSDARQEHLFAMGRRLAKAVLKAIPAKG
ncbi:hypothetical protein QFZ75_007965 [Streptomyces sp. V3I8]|uniref:hypothetical protein n=1 Tax=Streptomyces sp. V3I8 TaxID=3042279 RepID=UPI002780D8A5|nr:hypothetical protein [Streptomyces sp. V3I8]MDQ1041463.1 hypothetical protein [Streptomyces sp. V3I8]